METPEKVVKIQQKIIEIQDTIIKRYQTIITAPNERIKLENLESIEKLETKAELLKWTLNPV